MCVVALRRAEQGRGNRASHSPNPPPTPCGKGKTKKGNKKATTAANERAAWAFCLFLGSFVLFHWFAVAAIFVTHPSACLLECRCGPPCGVLGLGVIHTSSCAHPHPTPHGRAPTAKPQRRVEAYTFPCRLVAPLSLSLLLLVPTYCCFSPFFWVPPPPLLPPTTKKREATAAARDPTDRFTPCLNMHPCAPALTPRVALRRRRRRRRRRRAVRGIRRLDLLAPLVLLPHLRLLLGGEVVGDVERAVVGLCWSLGMVRGE